MSEPTTAILLGIQSIQAAIEIAKGVKSSTVSLKDAEVKLQIAELLGSLADSKLRWIDVQEENFNLKSRIKELEELLDQQDEVEFRDNSYFLKEPKHGVPKGLFCSVCYVKEKNFIFCTLLFHLAVDCQILETIAVIIV